MEWIESQPAADDSAATFNEWHQARDHGEPVTQTVIDRWRCQRADYDALVSCAIARETREHDGDMTLVRPS
jgi:hypothetical protein